MEMNRRLILSHFPAGLAATTTAPAALAPAGLPIYSARSFGASGQGKALDTAALNRAIDVCSGSGGGLVYLSPVHTSPAPSC